MGKNLFSYFILCLLVSVSVLMLFIRLKPNHLKSFQKKINVEKRHIIQKSKKMKLKRK